MFYRNEIKVVGLILISLVLISCGPKKDYLVTITTSFGEIKLILFDDTPLHKKNFLDLAEAGRYDGTAFYRVIPEFMIQGGDVNTKEGSSISAEAMIPAEIHPHNFHARGAVAAARSNNPERKSSECQFYIVQGRIWSEQELTLDQEKLNQYLRRLVNMPEYVELRDEIIELQTSGDMEALQAKMNEQKPVIEEEFQITLTMEVPPDRLEVYTTSGGAPHLDDEYTVFGQVIAGLEVVDAIAGQETDGMDKPTEDITMTVKVEQMKRSKITNLFGYQYPAEP